MLPTAVVGTAGALSVSANLATRAFSSMHAAVLHQLPQQQQRRSKKKVHMKPVDVDKQARERYGKVNYRKDLPLIQTQPLPDVPEIMQGSAQCPGCGALLQTKDQHAEGYVDPSAIDNWVEEEHVHHSVKQLIEEQNAKLEKEEKDKQFEERLKQEKENPEAAKKAKEQQQRSDKKSLLRVAEAAKTAAPTAAATAAASAGDQEDFFDDVLFEERADEDASQSKDRYQSLEEGIERAETHQGLDVSALAEMGELDEDLLNALYDSLSTQERSMLDQESEVSRETFDEADEEIGEIVPEGEEEKEAVAAGMKPVTEPMDDEEPYVDIKDLKVFERMEKQKYHRALLCSRCHQLTNYGKAVHFNAFDITPQDFYDKLRSTLQNDSQALVVKIIDIMDVENSIIPRFEEVISPENKLLLVANKFDLLPKGVSLTRVEQWLRQLIKERFGDKLYFKDIIMVSSVTGFGVKEMAAQIEKLRKEQNVYIVGSSNVGKSTLINKLIQVVNPPMNAMIEQAKKQEEHVKRLQRLQQKSKEFAGNRELLDKYKQEMEAPMHDPKNNPLYFAGSEGKDIDIRRFLPRLTTSSLPGTTLKAVSFILLNRDLSKERIKRDGETVISKKQKTAHLFDTPGVINKSLAAYNMEPHEWKFIVPKDRLRPLRYRLRPGRSIFIGGLVRIDYEENDVQNEDWNRVFFTLFMSPQIPVHTTSMDKASEFYQHHVGEMIYPPLMPPEPKETKEEKRERILREKEEKKRKKELFEQVGAKEFARLQAEEQRQKDEEQWAKRVEYLKTRKDLYPLQKVEKYRLEGRTRAEAICDIQISGLGWVSITGVGNIKIAVRVPKSLNIYVRKPIMPFETFGKLHRGKDFVDG